MTDSPHSLVILDKYRTLLAKAETLEEVTVLRSRADAVRVWAKSAAMGLEAQNKAAELKLRAERKAGELLSKLNLRGGDRKSNGHDVRLNLADLGINQAQSKRWQKEATVSEPDFKQYVEQATQYGEEVTAAGLLRLSRKAECAGMRKKATVLRQQRQEILSANRVGQLRESSVAYSIHSDPKCTVTERAEQLELVQEISDHHALLCSLLAPVCYGAKEDLLPVQLQAVRHYLAETRRLLALLSADQRHDRHVEHIISTSEARLA